MVSGKKNSTSVGDAGPAASPAGGRQPCRVETYSGYRLHERPLRFSWCGDWLAVHRVLARWQDPESLCFTVSASDSCAYLLKYYSCRDAWEVQVLDGSGSCPA